MRPRSTENMSYRSPVGSGPAAVPVARRGFASWLEDSEVHDDVAGELAVAFSELVANAVDAADGCERPVSVGSWFDDGDIVLEVVNPIAPSSPAAIERWDLEDPLRAGGRGLVIVRAYTDDVTVSSTDDTVVVRCRRRIDDAPAPGSSA